MGLCLVFFVNTVTLCYLDFALNTEIPPHLLAKARGIIVMDISSKRLCQLFNHSPLIYRDVFFHLNFTELHRIYLVEYI